MRCGETTAATLLEVAQAFGLAADPATYREFAREEAMELLAAILARDLAYGMEVMPETRARQLAKDFVSEAGDEARFFTNAFTTEARDGLVTVVQSNPATDATFDTGVLAVSARGGSCLWVEDED